MSIVSINPAMAREKFLKKPFELKHEVSDHPLFSLQRLVELAKSLPRDRIEYNSGKVAVGVKPEDVPKIDRPAEDVIRTIETANAWMVIKFVNEDMAYNELLKTFVEAANTAAGKNLATIPTCMALSLCHRQTQSRRFTWMRKKTS